MAYSTDMYQDTYVAALLFCAEDQRQFTPQSPQFVRYV